MLNHTDKTGYETRFLIIATADLPLDTNDQTELPMSTLMILYIIMSMDSKCMHLKYTPSSCNYFEAFHSFSYHRKKDKNISYSVLSCLNIMD